MMDGQAELRDENGGRQNIRKVCGLQFGPSDICGLPARANSLSCKIDQDSVQNKTMKSIEICLSTFLQFVCASSSTCFLLALSRARLPRHLALTSP